MYIPMWALILLSFFFLWVLSMQADTLDAVGDLQRERKNPYSTGSIEAEISLGLAAKRREAETARNLAAKLAAERKATEEAGRAAAQLEADRAENEAAKLRLAILREDFQRSIVLTRAPRD